MGLLKALVDSAGRFAEGLLPIGYERRHIRWVFEIDATTGHIQRNPKAYRREEMERVSPKAPGDRTSKVSPTLAVDDASYVFGIVNPGKKDAEAKAQAEHQSFIHLHDLAARYLRNPGLHALVRAIRLGLPPALLADLEPKDPVALRVGSSAWPFDEPDVRRFWATYLSRRFSSDPAACSLCGELRPSLRILPFNVRMFREKVPLVAVNTKEHPAFGSSGKEQMANSPACFSCLAQAQQVLQYLLHLDDDTPSGRHAVILARDESRGQGKQPLRNQIAVFWTKDPVVVNQADVPAGQVGPRTLEDAVRLSLEDETNLVPTMGPPAYASQLRGLLEVPFKGGIGGSGLSSNRFYLAVLSPNKSRLVVREWLDQDVEPVRGNLRRYIDALQIIHPDCRGVWFPPMFAMLQALRSMSSNRRPSEERGRLPQASPDLMRTLIRCMYTGQAPPGALLVRALRCFRVPDPPAEGEQHERQMLRRMALAAAMKLVLTHERGKEEMRAMEELKTRHDEHSEYKRQAPYQCGRLLAILEAAQRRASSSGRGVNTTQVDRFYGAASTAPATVFANLIGLATKGHLAKLRREGKEFFRTRSSGGTTVNINDLMTEVCDAIDQAGGFPPPLSPEQQAQFALGFYHQRADFSVPSKGAAAPSKSGAPTKGGKP